MSLTTPQLAAVSGAAAAWLLPYCSLEVADDTYWSSADLPGADDAFGLRVVGGQPLVNGGTRAELSIDFPWKEGERVSYRWKLWIPSAGAADPSNRWWIITQWHDQPNLDLGETWETWGGGHSPPLSISYGKIDGQDLLSINAGAPDPGYKPPLIEIERDTLYSMEMLVHWSQTSSGSAKLKMDGATVWQYTGANMQNAYQHYWKLGQYRHSAIAGEFWIWFDAIDAERFGLTRRPFVSPTRGVTTTSRRSS